MDVINKLIFMTALHMNMFGDGEGGLAIIFPAKDNKV